MTEVTQSETAIAEQLQIARSRLLDSFAEVEESVICLQTKFGFKASLASLGQRLETLRKVKASPQLSKATVTELQAHVERLAVLNELRADVVHARMYVAPIAGETRAFFVNSIECAAEFPIARLLKFDQFAKLNKELHELATALAKLAA